jgi:peptidoglycan/LPS O-acetylase OafA/YrhL
MLKTEVRNIRLVHTHPKLSPHLNFLDGLRAVAALYVVVHHAFLQIPHDKTDFLWFEVLEFPFRFGRFAVDLFIVLSGFCLMLPVVANNDFLKRGAYTFFKNRARRILPTYYLALAFSMLLIFLFINEKTGTQWDVSIPVTNWDIITHILLIQDMFGETSAKINHVFWSISVEWRIYFLFPLLLMGWRKWGALRTTALTVLASTFFWYALTQTNLNFYSMSVHYIGLFAFGMCAAYISKTSIKRYMLIGKSKWWPRAVFMTGILIAFTMASEKIQRNFSPLYTDYLMGFGSACFLVAVSCGHLPKFRQTLSWRPLVFTGTFAYSIYLIHAPLLQVISQFIIKPLGLTIAGSMLVLVALGIPAIVGSSYVFYLVAERPFINKKN